MTAWTVDHHGPSSPLEPGDFLVTTRNAYRVTAARPVESPRWPDRWRYEVEKVATRKDWPGPGGGFAGRVCFTETYHSPAEKPGHADFEPCADPRCEGCAAVP